MKNKLLLALSLMLIVLTGCATVIDIPYMKSSNVDMSHYKNIAIASTVPYKGVYMDSSPYMRFYDFDSSFYPVYSSYSRSLPNDIASYTTDAVVSALSSNGYFSIMSPSDTDAIIMLSKVGINSSEKFRERGIDAIVIPSVDDLKVDEYSRVYVDSYKTTRDPYTGLTVKTPHYTYAFYQKVSITVSLTVVDTKTERIITKRTYSKSSSGYKEYTYTPYGYSIPYSINNTPYSSLTKQVNNMKSSMINDFIPTRRYYSVELLANKPKVKGLQSAYKAAEDGNFNLAFNAFYDEWKNSHHVNSAYNAALLKAGMGDISGAIEFLSTVRESVSNSNINYLYDKLIQYKAEDDKAKAQMEATSNNTITDLSAANSIYSIYESLGK